jgi:hypothetical protein
MRERTRPRGQVKFSSGMLQWVCPVELQDVIPGQKKSGLCEPEDVRWQTRIVPTGR